MTKIKLLVSPDGQHIYQWGDREIDLGRIIGGFAPPGEQPGFLVVVGEQFGWRPPPNGQPAHAYLLAEYEDPDLGRLIQRATEFVAKYHVAEFYGNTRDEALIRYIVNFNQRARGIRAKPFRLLSAPFVEGPLSYHLQILRDRLSPTQKSLHFSRDSRLPNILLEFSQEEIFKMTEVRQPTLAALAYATVALTVWPPLYEDPTVARERQRYAREYNKNPLVGTFENWKTRTR
jgi:hypothetical protein